MRDHGGLSLSDTIEIARKEDLEYILEEVETGMRRVKDYFI